MFTVNLDNVNPSFLSTVPSVCAPVYPSQLGAFAIYLNICMNPFIYATKHDGVRRQLAGMLTCRKPRDDGDAVGSSNVPAGVTADTGTARR